MSRLTLASIYAIVFPMNAFASNWRVRKWAVFFCLFFLCAVRGYAVDDPWQAATGLSNAGKYAEAVAAFSPLIKQYPKDSRGYLGRGKAYWLLKNYSCAIEDFNQAISLDPKNVNSYNLRALALSDSGKREEALQDFAKAIKISPENPVFYYNRATTWSQLAKIDQAIEDCTQAIQKKPDYTPAYIKRGAFLEGQADYDRAIEDFNRALALTPKDANIFFQRAEAWNAKDQEDLALEDYNRAIELDPKNAKFFNNRGFLFQTLGEYDKALADYTSAIGLASAAPIHYNNRGNIWLEKGDTNKALADLNKALEMKSDYPKAYRNRAAVWLSTGDFKKAIADSTLSIEQSQGLEAKAYRIRAAAREALGDSQGAVKDAERAFILGPQPARGTAAVVPFAMIDLEKKALNTWLENDTPETREALAKVRHDYAFAILDLPTSISKKRFLEEAAAYAKSATVLAPENAAHWFLLGVIFRELATLDDPHANTMAEYAFTQAVEKQPDYAEAWLELALLQASEERSWEAMIGFENALENDPAATVPYAVGPLCAMFAINDEGLRGQSFFQTLYDANPEIPELAIGTAILLAHNGNLEEAMELANDLLLIEAPGTPSYEYAKKLLADWKTDQK